MASECVFDSPISDDDIDRLLDGERDASVIAHLKQCVSCRTNFLDAYQFETALATRSFRHACPSPEVIAHIAMHEEFDEFSQFEMHIQSCEKCQADLSMAREILMPGPRIDPPIIYMPTTVSWNASQPLRIQMPTTRIKSVQPIDVRSMLRGDSRSNAEIIEIGSLKIRFYHRRREGDLLSIFGQIADDKAHELWTETLLRIYNSSTLLAVSPLNDVCEFRCKVKSDAVNLVFTAKDGKTIIIDGVTSLEDSSR